MQISQSAREYVRFFAEDTGIPGIDIFCCDKTDGSGEIFEVHGYGMGHELKHSYRSSRIFEVDPFTDVKLREMVIDTADSFEMASDPRLVSAGDHAERYWRFMAQRDVEIIGAATRRYLPGFYLVIGLHRIRTGTNQRAIAYERLGHHLDVIKDMVSVNILNALVQSGDGHDLLRRSMGGGAGDCARVPVPAALTPRETEIAQLICLGKQNKQIAYMTGLSIHTVENHLKRMYRKLGIQNRAALVSRMNARIVH